MCRCGLYHTMYIICFQAVVLTSLLGALHTTTSTPLRLNRIKSRNDMSATLLSELTFVHQIACSTSHPAGPVLPLSTFTVTDEFAVNVPKSTLQNASCNLHKNREHSMQTNHWEVMCVDRTWSHYQSSKLSLQAMPCKSSVH